MSAQIGPRDLEVFTALDRCPLTPAQLCRLSSTFGRPFTDENNLRRRLRLLAESGYLSSWPYAIAGDGRSPRYFKLSRTGYRILHGHGCPLPKRRYFEASSPAQHYHTYWLAELVVHLSVMADKHGHSIEQYARENSVCLKAEPFTVYPDAAFVIRSRDGKRFPFCLELDNGTERVKTKQDVESIERKLRGYDAHQSQFTKFDPDRYLVLFVTTRSQRRMEHILDLAAMVIRDPQRTVFLGTDLSTLTATDPFSDAVICDHRGLKRTVLPTSRSSKSLRFSKGNVKTMLT